MFGNWREKLREFFATSPEEEGVINPYEPPAIEIPGKIVCGFDFSSSMQRHGPVASWTWENETLPKLESTWPGLEMYLLGVHNSLFEIGPCAGGNFVELSRVPRFSPEAFTRPRDNPAGLLRLCLDE